MIYRLSRTSMRALSALAALGAAATLSFSVAEAQQAPAAGGLVNPPGVAVSREPLNTNPDTWKGCTHVAKGGPNGVPGMLCAPSVQTGTPAIQEQLRAQQAAYRAANPAPAGRGGTGGPQPQVPMPCGPNANAAPAPAAAAGGRGPARPAQGGRGKIRVAFISHGHEYEREPMALMLDCLGDDITYSRVDYPAAELILNPQMAKNFDVYVFYDLGGPGVGTTGPNGEAGYRFYPDPSPALKKGFEAMVKAGKGMVFIHHASAAWAHTWPEYSEVVGGACDWYAPVTVRGILDPHHGYYGGTQQTLTVVDRNHPITKNLPASFQVTDEAYACAWFPDSVHPLVTTSFAPPDPLVNLNPRRQFSNLAAWYKASENSPVFYTQVGHDHSPWQVAEYQEMIRDAIRWAASPEALAWARKNHTTIWKTAAKAPAKK
ncbi:MAG: ThuA domain-containing protein [Alphaproteobacteria bacterium]|nr:ThuA domain-containing protein [Alphaproteobacteria bacterium]